MDSIKTSKNTYFLSENLPSNIDKLIIKFDSDEDQQPIYSFSDVYVMFFCEVF